MTFVQKLVTTTVTTKFCYGIDTYIWYMALAEHVAQDKYIYSFRC